MPQDTFHAGQGKRHRLFLDAADRLADDTQYVITDLGAFGIQLDSGKAFYLKSIQPTLWAPVSGGGEAALANVIDPVGTGNYAASAGERIIFTASMVSPVVDLPAGNDGDRVEVFSTEPGGMTSPQVTSQGSDVINQAGQQLDTVTQQSRAFGVSPLAGKGYRFIAALGAGTWLIDLEF